MRDRNRRDFLKVAGLGTAGAGIFPVLLQGCGSSDRSGSWRRPNIIFILADDLGYGDPGCNNPDSKIPTPNINRLAREGMKFTDAHSGSAVCTPTRYGILTGRYCWRTRLTRNVLWGYSPPLIEPGRMTVASLLGESGYSTACVGKWHLGLGWETTDGYRFSDRSNETGETVDYSRPVTDGPCDHGFDYFFGVPASLDMVPYVYIENDRVVKPPTERIEGRGGLAFYRAGPAAPDFDHEQTLPLLTEKAVGFIDRHMEENPRSPFFLYFPLTAPHTPVLPVSDYSGVSAAGDYGDFVAQVDGSVGQIMDTLDRHGISENTLIIFTSDNGSTMTPMTAYDHLPNDHLRGRKSDVWDGGHRIPYIARWPRIIEAGSSTDETISLTDLPATCAAITDTVLPDNAGEDSFDMLPAFRGSVGDDPIREATVHHSIEGMFAIRAGQWKLIEGRGSGGWTGGGEDDPAPGQLYDMRADLDEEENLYLEYPDVVERLSTLLERYRREGRSAPLIR